jgi:hypothetical protein
MPPPTPITTGLSPDDNINKIIGASKNANFLVTTDFDNNHEITKKITAEPRR